MVDNSKTQRLMSSTCCSLLASYLLGAYRVDFWEPCNSSTWSCQPPGPFADTSSTTSKGVCCYVNKLCEQIFSLIQIQNNFKWIPRPFFRSSETHTRAPIRRSRIREINLPLNVGGDGICDSPGHNFQVILDYGYDHKENHRLFSSKVAFDKFVTFLTPDGPYTIFGNKRLRAIVFGVFSLLRHLEAMPWSCWDCNSV